MANKVVSPVEALGPAPLILYGAGGAGQRAYGDLRRLNLTESVLAWVDNDPQKQAGSLFGHPIWSPDRISEHPESLVVICATGELVADIYRSLIGRVEQERIFVHLCFMSKADNLFELEEAPLYGDGGSDFEASDLLAKTLALFDPDDDYSREMVRLKIISHRDPAWFFQPAGAALNQPQLYLTWDERYWVDPETDLAAYEALTVCDVGAYTGDSLEDLWRRYGSKIAVMHAFEPDPDNFERLKTNCRKLFPAGLATCHNFGCGENNRTMSFLNKGNEGSRVVAAGTTGAVSIDVRRLDDLDLPVKGRLCLKMDIEGLELSALRGAAETIKRHRPELAISLYHKPGDLYQIPGYLRNLVPDYRFIIRGGPFISLYGRVGQRD